MMPLLPVLLKLSENEKRFLIVLFFVVIIIFFLLGLIYEGLNKAMAAQGNDIGRLMATQVDSGYISSLQQFRRNAYRKSRLEFYRQFSKTFIAIIIWFAVYGIVSIFYRHWLNLFDQTEEGFTTLFYTFDFANTPRTKLFGISVISDWPPVLHRAFFSVKAIPSYILAITALVIIILFIIQVLGFLSRTIFIIQHSKKMFTRDLKSYKLSDLTGAPAELQESGINVPDQKETTPPVAAE